MVFSIRDNGEPGKASDLISLVTAFGVVPLPSCETFFATPTIPIKNGNVQVH